MTAPATTSPARPWTAVLVDLDGTITDSAPGITGSLAHTFQRMGLPVPSPTELLAWVGPPILDSFRDLAHLDDAGQQRALGIYREHYLAHGVYDASLYAGVPEVLRAVHAAALPMSLATSKPESAATIVLEHFGLAGEFDVITGASDDEVRSAKSDVVAEALVRLAARGVDLSNPVMVGDRHHDVEGAAANGVPTVFVTWGYGAPAEAAGTVAIASTADELRVALGV